jgi:hypothetical protein
VTGSCLPVVVVEVRIPAALACRGRRAEGDAWSASMADYVSTSSTAYRSVENSEPEDGMFAQCTSCSRSDDESLSACRKWGLFIFPLVKRNRNGAVGACITQCCTLFSVSTTAVAGRARN